MRDLRAAVRKCRQPEGAQQGTSVADPDTHPDPYVFGPPGSASESISQIYGSGSFYHQAKIVRKH